MLGWPDGCKAKRNKHMRISLDSPFRLSTFPEGALDAISLAALDAHLVYEFIRADTVEIIDAILFGSLARAFP